MKGSLCLGEETPALRGRNEINKRVEKRRRKSWWNLDWWRKLFRSYGWTNLAIYKSYWHPNHHSREHKIHFFSLNSKCFEEKSWKSTLVQGGGSQKQMCDSLACWITQVAANGNSETVQHPTSALVNNATVQHLTSALGAISNIVLHQVVTSMQQCKMYHLLNQQCNSERSTIHK